MPSSRRLTDLYLIRYLRQKWQLPVALAAGVAAWLAAQWGAGLHLFPALLVGWDVFTALYLVIAAFLMAGADEAAIRTHADLYDDGEFAVLLLSILAAILSMGAIICILAPTPGRSEADKALHVVLSVATLALSWLFIHTTFAFHYAHGYYFGSGESRNTARTPPLQFPACTRPVYVDFLYFSFVIGTSGQTADVAFASSDMRFKGMIHCVVAYVFNAAVLGLSINIAAGIIGK